MPHKRRTPLQPLHFYHLEDLLYQFVCEANALVDGDGCSLFLWDEEVGRFVLRESTKMSPFIGRYCLDHNRPPGDNCGITSAVLSQKGVGGRLSPNVRRDRQWTWWGKRADGASEPEEHCELARKDLLSMIVLPLHPDPTAPGDQPAGVLRVVKKRGRTQFNVADKTRLENMTERNCSRIFGARSLSRLIELGSALDQRALCEQAVGVLSRMLSAKGCSIFLLDGARSAPPTRLVYSCEATTGLDRHQRD